MFKNVVHRDTQAPDARLAAALARFNRNDVRVVLGMSSLLGLLVHFRNRSTSAEPQAGAVVPDAAILIDCLFLSVHASALLR